MANAKVSSLTTKAVPAAADLLYLVDTSSGDISKNTTVGDMSSVVTGGVVISGSSTPTLAVTGTTAVSGSNTGDQTNISGNAATVTTNANLTGDVTSSGNATTLATVNSNVGSFTSANITVDGKGRVTAAANGSGGSGNMNTSTYDPAAIGQQVVGTTATQTLTNKTLTNPVVGTQSALDNSTKAASTAYTDSAVTAYKTATATETNKRITKRLVTTTQSATPTINTDNTDISNITGLAQAITSMTTNLSGTPVDGDKLEIRITDNGTSRSITWGASFESTTIILPTTTAISTMLRIGFEWNAANSKWDCIATA